MFPDELDELRRRDFRARLDAFDIEPAQRMLDHQQRQIGHAEDFRLGLPELLERGRAHHRRHQPALSQLCHVVDTPRRAGPSIGHGADDDVGLLRELVENLGRRGQAHARLAQRSRPTPPARSLFTDSTMNLQQVIGVALAVVEHAEAYAALADARALRPPPRAAGRGRFGNDEQNFVCHEDPPELN